MKEKVAYPRNFPQTELNKKTMSYIRRCAFRFLFSRGFVVEQKPFDGCCDIIMGYIIIIIIMADTVL